MKMRLAQKMAQRMALTPQMRQSIHILQLPLLELRTYLRQQMEENPVLEERDESEFKERLSDREIVRLVELSNEDRRDSGSYYNAGYNLEEIWEKQGYRESLITKQPTLQEYLLRQLGLQPLNETEYKIGRLIISNIDENGYFQEGLEEIRESLKIGFQDVQNALSLIQTFEPAGVGARNLKECLLIQLKSTGRDNSLAYQIVENYLVDLAKNRTELIAKRLKAPLLSVKKALKEISFLEPKPGRAFSRVETRYILPDIIVEKIDDYYKITINGREVPLLKISSRYKDLLNRKDTPEEVRGYLKERLGSALWLIKVVDQRKETIRRVAECIVQSQSEFFEQGRGYLKPLTMKQVAEMVGRNESTISRVVNNKYMQTPHGIFELRYFFSGSFKTDTQERVSADAVKMRITNLIQDGDREHPLSDAKIVDTLRTQGINLARRTVAKYREELKILPSHLRKRSEITQ